MSNQEEQLKNDLESLQKTYRDMMKESKESTEKQIKAQFEKLHQFLREEEESSLAALREEEERVSREMKKMEEQTPALSVRSDPQLSSGLLINVAKQLGNLSLSVWRKMKKQVHFTPVILDPNTAHCRLRLSDDLTSVRLGKRLQQCPENPERFTKYPAVLGSEGFSSGIHMWEVEVGEHPDWIIGLVKESIERKGEEVDSQDKLQSQDKMWCLFHCKGKYTNANGETVKVQKSLHRIKVRLIYDRGTVAFYNSKDNARLYTDKGTFTEKLFPFFCVGKSDGAKTTTLTVCQAEITL